MLYMSNLNAICGTVKGSHEQRLNWNVTCTFVSIHLSWSCMKYESYTQFLLKVNSKP